MVKELVPVVVSAAKWSQTWSNLSICFTCDNKVWLVVLDLPHWRTLFLDILEKVLPSPPVTLILQQKGDTCLSAPPIIFPTSQFLSKRLPCSQPFWPSQACRHLPFRSTSWPFAILLLNQGSFPQLIMSGQYIHTCTCMWSAVSRVTGLGTWKSGGSASPDYRWTHEIYPWCSVFRFQHSLSLWPVL